MRINRLATFTAIGITAAGLGAAAFVAAATSSAAAPTHTHAATHTHVTANVVVHQHASSKAKAVLKAKPVAAAKHASKAAAPADVVSTSRQQVAWTQRAEADTTPAVNNCTPIKGSDGKPVIAGGGGYVYPALVNDPQAEADEASMYEAMAAGDQSAYDAAYHQLDLRVNCD